jgi:hypothetical protein
VARQSEEVTTLVACAGKFIRDIEAVEVVGAYGDLVGTEDRETSFAGLFGVRFGDEARWIPRVVFRGKDEELGGTIETLNMQVKQEVASGRLYGKEDGLVFNLCRQGETQSEIGVAVTGGPKPSDLRIGWRLRRRLRQQRA